MPQKCLSPDDFEKEKTPQSANLCSDMGRQPSMRVGDSVVSELEESENPSEIQQNHCFVLFDGFLSPFCSQLRLIGRKCVLEQILMQRHTAFAGV